MGFVGTGVLLGGCVCTVVEVYISNGVEVEDRSGNLEFVGSDSTVFARVVSLFEVLPSYVGFKK